MVTELQVPEILNNYLIFCNLRQVAIKRKVLDLTWCEFLFPTTLLPMGILMHQQMKKVMYLAPYNHNVKNYLSLLLQEIKNKEANNTSSFSCKSLPQDQALAQKVLSAIFNLHNHPKEYGQETTFKYILSEYIDNIYEHAQATISLVMMQKYEKGNFIEICIIDNGITIGGNFKEHGLKLEDYDALIRATNGFSTKGPQRGYGLNSTLKIITEGLKGEILIVSGSGAAYLNKQRQKIYKLQEDKSYKGTLISIRLPYSTSHFNIYDFLN